MSGKRGSPFSRVVLRSWMLALAASVGIGAACACPPDPELDLKPLQLPPDLLVTLETGSDSNKFLKCAEQVLGTKLRNGNTDEGFSNLINASRMTTMAVLSGHGNSGFMCTGDGDHCGSSRTIIDNLRESSWAGAATKIYHKFWEVRLLGCNVGADIEGARLLAKLAKRMDITVSAPTDFVWCGRGKLWISGHARWQEVEPGLEPIVIPRPAYHARATGVEKVWYNGRLLSLRAGSVHAVKFEYRSPIAASPLLPLQRPDHFVAYIDFGHPLSMRGYAPAAVVTARATVSVTHDKRTEQHILDIYNDEFAEDGELGIFYPIDSQLRRELIPLRRRLEQPR